MLLDQGAIEQVLANGLAGLVPPDTLEHRVVLADDAYLPAELDWVLATLRSDPVLSPARYARNIFDCDDYVMYLKCRASLFAQQNRLAGPLAIGFLFTRRHAFNFCIDPASALHLIDTQSEDKSVEARPEHFASFLGLSERNPIRLVYL